MTETILVIPCYNESERLDLEAIANFLDGSSGVELLFVDDGSTDDTHRVLTEFKASHPGNVDLITLDQNQGKAEAVRLGMLEASRREADFFGYWDADLSTPLGELKAFRDCLHHRPEIEMVFGARVDLLGRSIRRNLFRHYISRLFATLAAYVLGMGVYDTQCGAKLFRNSEGNKELFREPFLSRWIFDVELIARLIQSRKASDKSPAETVIFECPLMEWQEVRGSKLRLRDFVLMSMDLTKIHFHYKRNGRR